MKNKSKKGTAIALLGLVIALALLASPGSFLARASKGLFYRTLYGSYRGPEEVVLEAKLTEDEAIKIAEDTIGTVVTLLEIELDSYRGVVHYDVEMMDDNYEYELEIHADTGEVLDFEKEKRDDNLEDVGDGSSMYISQDEAIALAKDAIKASATVDEVDFEDDDDLAYYKVELENETTEFEVKVNALTGEILKVEQKRLDEDDDHNNIHYIGKERAIALAKEAIKTSATVVDVDFEDDDDLAYYKVELENETTEFEVKINALTGEILKVEQKQHDEDDNHGLDVTYISEEKALQIAQDRIGSNAILVELELDDDDNPSTYDLELEDDMYEYEVTIHAVTGAILDFEKDLID